MARAQGRPTIDDVAAAAGVSRSTVSRVLTGHRWVSPPAEQAIRHAIDTTGYIVSRSARSLRTGRAQAVALVITDEHQHLFEDPSFGMIIRALDAELGDTVSLYITLATTMAARRNVVDQARSGGVDGLILIATRDSDPIHRLIAEARVPAVAVSGPPPPGSPIPYANVDQAAGAAMAARHLLDGGCRLVAVIVGPADTASARERAHGARTVLGLQLHSILHTDFYSRRSGSLAVRSLLAHPRRPDALFAASDILALGALDELEVRGIRVPVDIQLIGFDDTPDGTASHPPLTTIRIPTDLLAHQTITLLRTPLRPQPTITCSLVVRQSTRH